MSLNSYGQSTNADILQQAKIWVSTCREQHDLCSGPGEIELPTRLIAVDRNEAELSAHLCDGNSLPSNTNYATVSHCWGDIRFLTLKQGNLKEMKQSIPVRQLPQVFQESLLVAYELGLSIRAWCL
jgi:hypothetical protein